MGRTILVQQQETGARRDKARLPDIVSAVCTYRPQSGHYIASCRSIPSCDDKCHFLPHTSEGTEIQNMTLYFKYFYQLLSTFINVSCPGNEKPGDCKRPGKILTQSLWAFAIQDGGRIELIGRNLRFQQPNGFIPRV